MALSDYSFIAFDNNGETSEKAGDFGIITIEPYKTWLYIGSQKLWDESSVYVKPTIAQISSGEIDLFGVSIIVEPVKLVNKDGIPYSHTALFYCQRGYGAKAKCFGGVVTYAYLNYVAKIAKDFGIPDNWDVSESSSNVHPLDANRKDKKWYKYIECFPTNQPEGDASDEEWEQYFSQKKTIVLSDLPEYEGKLGLNAYCGITEDMVNAFLNWGVPNKEWLQKIKNNPNKKWVNPGNAYLGVKATQKVGECESPAIHKFLK